MRTEQEVRDELTKVREDILTHKCRIAGCEERVRALEDELRDIERTTNSFLPPGFSFGYNDRRGDPLFNPYFYCVLLGEDGKVVWERKYYEDKYNREDAHSAAYKESWRLYDIHKALEYYQKLA